MNYYNKYLKYKNKYLNLKEYLINEKLFFTNNLTTEEKEYLFNMYVISYSGAGNDLWFKTPNDLFNPAYACGIIIEDESTDLLNIKAYSIFQKKKYVNKLSLTCHDGTPIGKQYAINLRLKYVNKPNWIIEASGATAWILRKNGAPLITDKITIEKLLEIDGVKEQIILNTEFNINDFNNIDNMPNKSLFYYYHIYKNSDGSEIINNETLFGIEGCDNFDTISCNRKCLD